MFSSFFASIAVPLSSPKAILASQLSAALAVYFVVDPSTIETNLVSDTKIALTHVKLKPQTIYSSGNSSNVGGSNVGVGLLELVGDVECVEFSWKWGGSADGSTSFVRDTFLSIRGVRLRLQQ